MPSSKGPNPKDASTIRWVVVQLSNNGEHEPNLAVIERSIDRILRKKLSVFIPATMQKARSDNQTIFYMDGYIFIEYQEGIQYHRLNGTNYFETVVSSSRDRLSLLSDSDLEPLRKGVESLKIGAFKLNDQVKVTKGTFKNLTGTISFVYDGGEQVQVNLKLSSKPMLIDYPSSFLTKL